MCLFSDEASRFRGLLLSRIITNKDDLQKLKACWKKYYIKTKESNLIKQKVNALSIYEKRAPSSKR